MMFRCACFVALLTNIATFADAFVPAVERSSAFQPMDTASTIASSPFAYSLQSGACRLSLKSQGKDDGSSSTSSDEQPPRQQGGGFFQAVGSFFEELDAFMDDAS
jgi:hypothetical protein